MIKSNACLINSNWLIRHLALLSMVLVVSYARAGEPARLTPGQLVMLAKAAKERYWSTIYSFNINTYRFIKVGDRRKRVLQSKCRQLWRWTPWRIYCHSIDTFQSSAGLGTMKNDIFDSFDGTSTTYMVITAHANQAWSQGWSLCQINHGNQVLGSLVDTIWGSWLWMEVTNTNSKVLWDSRSHQYILDQVLDAKSKRSLRYRTWIDPDRGYVVTRNDSSSGGKVFIYYRYRHWHEVKKGLWLPFQFSYGDPGVIENICRIQRVVEINKAIPPSELNVKIPNGTSVYNTVTDHVYHKGKKS